ncbi:hypothetical protein GCM10027277_11210 [Pseudoduganella ginsengisoli]|nr:GNAT family N-acetyltransferase [Pseudoduganella ginsengisoli]
MSMPVRDTLTIHFHADQTVTIEGVTLAAVDATPLLESMAKRTPPPLLKFVPDEGAGYETVGRLIYQAVRVGFPDESFGLIGKKPTPVLRKANDADLPFLMELRHQCMDTPMLAAGKTPSDELHRQRILYQFEWAEIVELAGEPVGLLKVVRSPPVWDLIQIQVAPREQGKGLGSLLLHALMAQAMAYGASIKLSVFKVNPALHLYERLGFVVIGETDDAYDMLFTAPA